MSRSNRSDIQNPGEKYAGITDFMFKFATRVSATFKVRWTDIKDLEDVNGNVNKAAYVRDKGVKINVKVMADNYYQSLREMYFTCEENDTLFHELSERTFTNMMTDFSKVSGRNVTPHSLKVGAVTRLYDLTHNIMDCQ
ncbi:tyrosine-type recombinase/integrase [Lacticaseibacillus baoqingensis]|uniref:Tyrosine-type recombinase/integrase n=2 Tax=Lacticaseibacillus baoqingensis TaxID=2486013 RepID=A0ABW4E4G9_9LACO